MPWCLRSHCGYQLCSVLAAQHILPTTKNTEYVFCLHPTLQHQAVLFFILQDSHSQFWLKIRITSRAQMADFQLESLGLNLAYWQLNGFQDESHVKPRLRFSTLQTQLCFLRMFNFQLTAQQNTVQRERGHGVGIMEVCPNHGWAGGWALPFPLWAFLWMICLLCYIILWRYLVASG